MQPPSPVFFLLAPKSVSKGQKQNGLIKMIPMITHNAMVCLTPASLYLGLTVIQDSPKAKRTWIESQI